MLHFEFEFEKDKLVFKMPIHQNTPEGYMRLIEPFGLYGLQLPLPEKALIPRMRECYSFEIGGAINCFKACAATAEHYVYGEDDKFYIWVANALYALSNITEQEKGKLKEDEKTKLIEVEFNLKLIQIKKNKELLEVQNQLRQLTEKYFSQIKLENFPIPSESDDHQTILQQNEHLILENNRLYREITDAAREEATQYNDSAIEAIILSLSMNYVNNQAANLFQEAQSTYENHLNPPQKSLSLEPNHIPLVANVQLPEPGKIYPFLEPKKEFPHLKDEKYRYFSVREDRLTIAKTNVDSLTKKVDRVFNNRQKCQEEQSLWSSFLTTLKNGFEFIYNGIMDVLRSALESDNPVEQHSDLAENVENITNGVPITEKAQRIPRFNSRPSPLIDIIYDTELKLTNEEKEDLLSKLAQAKPYRFQHEPVENRKNIEIPFEGKTRYTSEGSPLHHAVQNGTANMVKILLENGANPNTKGYCIDIKDIDYRDVTPLHLAVAQNDIEKVKLLIKYGANVNEVNKNGETPLHAVSNIEIFNLLISAGADVNKQDVNAQTPLHFAVKYGKPEIVNALVGNSNIQINLQDNRGNTALHLAAAASFEMANGYHPGYPYSNGDSESKKKQNLQIMGSLLNKAANPNTVNKNGYSPLHMAVLDSNKTINYDCCCIKLLDYQHIAQQVKLLCKKGANVNCMSKPVDSNYYDSSHPAPSTTPLLALYTYESFESVANNQLAQNRLDVAKYLIFEGAKCDLYQQGNSLLHQCAKFADKEAFKYFCNLGLDPNYQKTEEHDTPFHVFMKRHANDRWDSHRSTFMRTLFDKGVDVNKPKIATITVDWNNLRSSLSANIIEAIFKHDNIISQKARELRKEINAENPAREILKEIYTIISPKENQPIVIKIPLTAVETSTSSEAIEMVEKYQREQPQHDDSLTRGINLGS